MAVLTKQDSTGHGVIAAVDHGENATGQVRDTRELALADFCQVLMCLNDFIYVD